MATPTGAPTYQISDAVNEDDRGLVITSVAAILLVASCLFFLLRLWVRWPWKALFAFDDACTCIAQVFGVIQTAVTLAAVRHGLGRKGQLLSESHVDIVQKLVFTADLLFVVAVWLSRMAVALIFLRLAGNRERARHMRIVVYVVAALSGASLLVAAIREHTLHAWLDSLGKTMWYRWLAAGAMGIVAEFGLLAVSIILVWKVQMQRTQKYTVVSGFAARMMVLFPLALRLLSLNDNVDSTNVTFDLTLPILWTQAEMHLCLIAATIPCLRIFLKSFNTGYYGMDAEQFNPSGTIMATKGGSYNLSDLRSGGSVTAGHSQDQKDSKRRREQRLSSAGMNTSRVTTRDVVEEGDDAMSEGSDRIIIRKTVNVMYE